MSKTYTFKGMTGTEYVLNYLENNAVASTKGITAAMMADIDPHEGEINRTTISYYIKALRNENKIHSPRTGLWMFGPAGKSNKNGEGYSDPTASQALLNAVAPENVYESDKGAGPVYGEIWYYNTGKTGKKADDKVVMLLILGRDDEFVNVLYVIDADEFEPKGNWAAAYTPICNGLFYVLPTRVFSKPVKYFMYRLDNLFPSEDELKAVKAGLAATFGIIPTVQVVTREVPVEKVVEKIKRVEIAVPPEGMEKKIEMLQLKIDIYESVMKAQGLLS